MTDEEAARKAKSDRRKQYLGQLSETEQLAVSKFMGAGPNEAVQKLAMLTPITEANFKKSSLLAFQKYVSLLAGTVEDKPNAVWTKRKQLLDKAISLKLGSPG